MTLTGRLMSLFPALHLLLLAACLWAFVARPSALLAVTFVNLLYLVPPLLWQVYRAFLSDADPERHSWRLDVPERCEWWAAHQFQSLYAVFPALEAMLRVIPGAYSAWLRLWGSRIGRGVYWTPNVELLDRHNLTIGDRVVFGHRVVMTGHAVHRKAAGEVWLLARGVTIGDDCFLGATSRYGPGAVVPNGSTVPFGVDVARRYEG